MPASRPPWHYLLLWLIAILSLIFNVLLLIGLNNLQRDTRVELQRASAQLASVELEEVEVPVRIDESLAVSLTVPFSDTFVVPFSATIPISTAIPFNEQLTVPFSATFPIQTAVTVNLPALGPLNLPIATTVPVSIEVEIPISRTIPVQLSLPVNLTAEVPVNTEVPIVTEIPIQMDFPVQISLDEMGLGGLLASLREALDGVVASLGG